MTKKTKLTPWYPASTKPVRKGVYQVNASIFVECEWYSYWNGSSFCWLSLDADVASAMRLCKTKAVITQWRGVTK